MTIEENINRLILLDLGLRLSFPLEKWRWVGEPNPFFIGWIDKFMIKVDLLIAHADSSECLTSTSEYIRECKKWFMDNGTAESNYITLLRKRLGDSPDLQNILLEAIDYVTKMDRLNEYRKKNK